MDKTKVDKIIQTGQNWKTEKQDHTEDLVRSIIYCKEWTENACNIATTTSTILVVVVILLLLLFDENIFIKIILRMIRYLKIFWKYRVSNYENVTQLHSLTFETTQNTNTDKTQYWYVWTKFNDKNYGKNVLNVNWCYLYFGN